jgi:PAS domain S-box-containing protein
MQDALIGTDENGTIRTMNVAAETITGWPADAVFGRELKEVFRIDEHAGGPNGRCNVLVTRDRRSIAIEGHAESIRDSRGCLREIRVYFNQPSNLVDWPASSNPPQDAA